MPERRWTSILWWAGFAVCGLGLVVHFSLIQISNMPMSAAKLKMASLLDFYVNPYFSQRWNFFAPTPPTFDIVLFARGRYFDPDTGEIETTDWVDVSDALIGALRANRLTSLFHAEISLSNALGHFANDFRKDPRAFREKDGKKYLRAEIPADIDPADMTVMRRTALANLEITYPTITFQSVQLGITVYTLPRFTGERQGVDRGSPCGRLRGLAAGRMGISLLLLLQAQSRSSAEAALESAMSGSASLRDWLAEVRRFASVKHRTIALAVLRISVGLTLLVYYSQHILQREYLWGNAGLVPFPLFQQIMQFRHGFSLYLLSSSSYYQAAVFYVGLVVTIAFTLGYRLRISSILFYVFTWSLFERNIFLLTGGDNFLYLVAFFLMFADSGAHFSLDAISGRSRTQRRPFAAMVHNYAVLAIIIQLSLVYLTSAFYKTMRDPCGRMALPSTTSCDSRNLIFPLSHAIFTGRKQ